MRPSTQRALSILLSFLFLVGALVVYQNLIRPESKEISRKRGLVAAKTNLFETQSQAVNQVQNLISQIENFSTLAETVALAIPNRPEVPEVFNQIETISRLSGVNVTGVGFRNLGLIGAPGNLPLMKKLGALEFKLTAIGPYENIKNFLKLLESNLRVGNINGWDFSRAGQIYNISFSMIVYYQQ